MQGIEKTMEEFYAEFPELNDFPGLGSEIKSFIRQAIESAFCEVRPENDLDKYGDTCPPVSCAYNSALSDLDSNIAKYLGK